MKETLAEAGWDPAYGALGLEKAEPVPAAAVV